MFYKLVSTAAVLGLSFTLTGCVGSEGEYRELGEGDNVTNTAPPEEHHHHHDEGPHGGHILEFGDYHGEIVFADGTVSVYVLGDDAETAVPLENASAVLKLGSGDESKEIALAATPQEGEAEGSSSRYSAAAADLPEGIKDLEDITGSVLLTVGEKTLTAKVEHDHDHHDH